MAARGRASEGNAEGGRHTRAARTMRAECTGGGRNSWQRLRRWFGRRCSRDPSIVWPRRLDGHILHGVTSVAVCLNLRGSKPSTRTLSCVRAVELLVEAPFMRQAVQDQWWKLLSGADVGTFERRGHRSQCAELWLRRRPPRRACFARGHHLHRLGADAAQRVLCHARLVVCFANHATSACRCAYLLYTTCAVYNCTSVRIF